MLENAIENPLDKSTGKVTILWKNTIDNWQLIGEHPWRTIWKCHWKSTMISEVSISGEQSFAPNVSPIVQMTRSSGKSAQEGKPHIGPSETWDAGCRFAVPRAPDCGCFFPTRKPAHFPVQSFSRKTRSPNSSERFPDHRHRSFKTLWRARSETHLSFFRYRVIIGIFRDPVILSLYALV